MIGYHSYGLGTIPGQLPLSVTLPTQIGASVAGAASGAAIAGALQIGWVGGPIGGAIAVAVGLMAQAIESAFTGNAFSVPMSQAANQAEKILQANLAAWQALSLDQKTPDTQLAALNNFDTVWNWYTTACNQIIANDPTGSDAKKALARSIGDRAQGGKFDWFAAYRNPIATDVTVSAGSTVNTLLSPVTGQISSVLGFDVSGLVVPIGLVIAALIIWRKD